jgi:hypothetical protein
MKAFVTFLILFSLGTISGCNNVSSFASNDAMTNQLAGSCCNDENFQSGYYYNGYNENGWRYCVVKPK